MVVLASSIVTKNGKALVSRQFVDMTRIRIEGLLAAFPKLVGSGKQHTYVETENVRYVYQPLEALYLLLVTNKASNILEDLETLRLLAKVVPEYVPSLDEDGVSQAAFELLFAFDEAREWSAWLKTDHVISLGHKDNVTVMQVRQNTEMESHEEKLHKMIIQSKINDTKDLMKRKAMEIDKSKIDRREGSSRLPGFSPTPGMGGISMDSPSAFQPVAPAKGLGIADRPSAAGGKKGPSKGMQLGKAKKGASDFLEAMAKEGEAVAVDNGNSYKSGGAAALATPVHAEPVGLAVEEKLTVLLNKDGGMENMEVQGSMSLQVYQEEELRVRVAVAAGDNAGFQFKTHPNIDKTLYAEQSVLGLKDPSRPFPAGNPLGILKWRYQTRDESMVPLSINCWPSVSGGESYVNIEYEATADFDLQNVVISIPLPALSQAPRVPQIDGDWRYDSRHSQLVWSIDLIDASNRSGAAEFVVPATDPGTFFPVEVSFSAQKTLCDIQVSSVTTTDTGAPVKYAYHTTLVTEEYQVA